MFRSRASIKTRARKIFWTASTFAFAAVAPHAGAISTVANFQFDFLAGEMPEAFELGQSVTFAFEIDPFIAGQSDGEGGTSFAGAITDFSVAVPDVGFSVSSGSGDIFQDVAGDMLFSVEPDARVDLGGQRFLSAEIGYELTSSLGDGATDPLNHVGDFEAKAFELFFEAPDGDATSGVVDNAVDQVSGLEMTAVPEPGSVGLWFGLAVLALARARRRDLARG